MVKASILSVSEALGKWIVIDLQLGYLCVLISSDGYKICVWNRDGDIWLACLLNNNLHCILVHGMKKDLQKERTCM